ncbi:hypothetical protein [Vibrio cortegadensis]|uniref:hypothetical protein n=1 Tax=Vibrio cortegadensis TaxID=1328770 RepID=UPI00352F25F2
MYDDDRTTLDLIETLGNDYNRIHLDILDLLENAERDSPGCSIEVDVSFESRILVRALFAYIEAVAFSMKLKAVKICHEEGIKLTDAEYFFAVEKKHEIKENGETFIRPAQIRFLPNLRFAFNITAKSFGKTATFDPNTEWWVCLKQAVKIRDRLTHPKLPTDLDIYPDELINVMKARAGFDKYIMDL